MRSANHARRIWRRSGIFRAPRLSSAPNIERNRQRVRAQPLLSSICEDTMSRLPHTAALAIGLAAFGAACATTILNVSSHVRPGIDIGQYRTFAWGPADALPTGDPRLDHLRGSASCLRGRQRGGIRPRQLSGRDDVLR